MIVGFIGYYLAGQKNKNTEPDGAVDQGHSGPNESN
jgi:hypothetical protein